MTTVKYIITSGRPLIHSYIIDNTNVSKKEFEEHIKKHNLENDGQSQITPLHRIFNFIKKQ